MLFVILVCWGYHENTSMNNLLQQLEEIVAFRTVDGANSQKQQCIRYFQNEFEGCGLDVKYFEQEGLPSLVATTHDEKVPKVLLMAHIDVVPGTEKLFSLQDDENRLFGRGVYDMKFAAACYLQLAKELGPDIGKYNFGIMLTTDEEIGGENGVGMLLGKGYGGNVCILPDGGDNWQIESVCNGVWAVHLTAKGRAAHGSKPWDGENAIDKLVAGLDDIRHLFSYREPEKCSLTLSQISGGNAFNQVPAHAEATLDMRFIDGSCYQEKRDAVEEIVSKHKLTLKTISQVDPHETDLKHPEVAQFIKIAQAITDRPIDPTRSTGSSDARFFDAAGIPVILIRPHGGGAHSEDEWIDKDGLFEFYDVLKNYVTTAALIT